MTRRERLEARLTKRQQWANARATKSSAGFARARTSVEHIPPGQPILVGHYSEKHHRRDLARYDQAMAQATADHQIAAHHTSKAGGLAQQLERSIFADDADAISRLEAKVAEEEATVAHWKKINTAYRKAKGAEGWGDALGLAREVQARLAGNVGRYTWITAPIEAYQFSNARTRIRQAKGRIKSIRAQHARHARAEAAGGVVLVETPLDSGDAWAVITFGEKPDREILLALKEAGFRWASGSWCGYAAKIPDRVRSLLPAKRD